MKKIPTWAIVLAAFIGIVAIGAGTLYVASWIVLPFLKVPFRAHTNFIFIDYWRAYPQLHEKPMTMVLMMSLGIVCAPLLIFTVKKPRSLHGDAKFATAAQVKKAGMLAEKGIIVGRRGNDYLIFGGQQHVLMAAPTRSGKGVGIVIPNLLNWSDSVVVLDIKQENWDLTAGFRAAHGQACFLFNPAAEDRRTHRYNPLDYISDDEHFRINDVQKIASMLYPDMPGVDPIWNASCRSLFVGIVLYLKETPSLPCTLGQVLRSTLTSEDTAKHFKRIIEQRAEGGDPLSSECITALNDFVAVTSENTRSSIKKTFTSRLELWLNPVIDAATSHSDFNLRDLRRKRMSIYVGITPDNLDRLQPIINLLFQQILDQNTRELPSQNPKQLKYSCLLLMDEFTSIGRINVLSKGISYVAGYNLRMLPIIQSPAQLREVYGKDAADTFAVNHALNIVFAPREFSVCKEISESLGYETVKSASVSKKKNFFAKKDPNESISDQRRALLLPQEVRDIGPDNCLLLMEGTPPIQAKKIKYYEDPTFKARLMDAPAVQTLTIGSALTSVRTAPAAFGEPVPPTITAQIENPAIEAPEAQATPFSFDDFPSVTSPPMLDDATVQAESFDPSHAIAYTPADPEITNDRPTKRLTRGRQFPADDELLPTTVALLGPDPFALAIESEPEPEPPAEAVKPARRTRNLQAIDNFSMDASDVQIESSSTMSVDELRLLHKTFLEELGAAA